MWVRGLKLTPGTILSRTALVAPHVGAWIETLIRHKVMRFRLVAPHVGAWIETNSLLAWLVICWSHPMWVRGLKQV